MNAKIDYKLNTSITAKELSQLFKASGIKRPADDLPRLQKMITNADLTFSAWDGEKLAGIARAITDFSYCCYLSDLAVDKDYQKCGIGKRLVTLLREEIGDEVTLLLLSSPIAMEYYPRIGFEKADNGFKIMRRR
ncbi:GNAT family N-acetyltransferase [Neobacillus mesonae]|uniref:GNAT family N-acetyltransferase n=1 Tax=Neobacillus mesonae TaxID=1193713 RepID=UPI00203AEC3C|nr:GNAT family N-acetyltransferase [Neobacillus mesonae]MCM3569946.1 GNAT family N-acetyltransferase [Neobacillus mesonae]